MSKAVLLSVRPEWAEKIVGGEKNIEVRKTRPTLATPFKVYLYVTAGNLSDRCPNGMICHCNGGRAVIGEFICDKVDWITRVGFSGYYIPSRYSICDPKNMSVLPVDDLLHAARLSYMELADYLDGGNGYGWHISDLLIYDQPRELTEFRRPCPNDLYCEACAMCSNNGGICNNGALSLRRPPQSWCYVEEVQ